MSPTSRPESPLPLAIVVTGTLLAVAVLGGVQLQSDERLAEPFLKSMPLSFAYLLLNRRRSEPNEGS